MSVLGRVAVGLATAVVALGLSIGGQGTAAATSSSDLGAAGYQALFNANVPVFEAIGIEHFNESGTHPGSDGNYLHMRRIPNAQAGNPGTVKYAIGGRWMPDDFYLPTNFSGGRLPAALTNPRPSPYGYPITYWDEVRAMIVQVGPVFIPGVPAPSIAGAVAFAY